MTTAQRLSVEEYLALPECKPYLEYVGGEARAKMAPAWEHFILAGRLMVVLAEYARAHGGDSGAEGRVEFEDDLDRRFLLPDLAYYAASRQPRGRRAMTAPTLAIEIRSTDESMASQREKCHYYLAHGVDAALLVDPGNRAAEVFEGGRHLVFEDPAVVTLDSLPGLEFRLGELFVGLD
jgi:Uma2 family endonuclease